VPAYALALSHRQAFTELKAIPMCAANGRVYTHDRKTYPGI
jgi:hypothetical protein